MTHPNQLTGFRKYLSSLPDDLLTSLTRCYIWLAGLRFTEGKQPTGLEFRRDCCLAECAWRGEFPIRRPPRTRCNARDR